MRGLSCDVLDKKEDREDCKKITTGAHSYRSWKDVDFGHLFEQCKEDADSKQEKSDCEGTVRKGMRWVEAGRFHDALNEMYHFIVHLDRDEKVSFAKRNKNIVERANEWARVEEMRKFDELLDMENNKKIKLSDKVS